MLVDWQRDGVGSVPDMHKFNTGSRQVAFHKRILFLINRVMKAANNVTKRLISASGFRLTVITTGIPDEERITKFISQVAPGASLKEKFQNSVVYVIPVGTDMSTVFNTVEMKKHELDIMSLSIGITTLEEVFIE